MAKPKKESKPCSLRMETSIYKKLEDFCQKTGISKTTVLEKGVIAFIESYYARMKSTNEEA